MATFIALPRNDGSGGYTTQIRIKRDGHARYTTLQAFDKEKDAQAWAARKDKDIAIPGALDAALHPSGAPAQALDRYVEVNRNYLGKTNAQVSAAIKRDSIAALDCDEIRGRDIVASADRRSVGRQPQSVPIYLHQQSAVFGIA